MIDEAKTPQPGDEQAPAPAGATAPPEAGGEPKDGSPREESAPETRADGDGDGAAALRGDIDELMSIAEQRDKYLALAQRTQADFENYRKRVAKEAASAQERGVAALAKELLPALDNLDRALDAAAADDPLLDGVRLVRSELSAALARLGIESFSPLGEEFDPSLHEALAAVPQSGGADAAPSGVVVEVYQPGYRSGANVIRPARVVVSA